MPSTINSAFLALASAASLAAAVGVTPHVEYSSSVGVLGCKIDTNRVAYFPQSVDCDKICIKVSNQGRSVNLLRIDQSGGAHDISYDAWNFLVTGKSAKENPTTGGAVEMTVEDVPAQECDSLIKSAGRLPLSAANSMNFLTSCGPNTFVGKNHELFNIGNPTCTVGFDEVCKLDLAVSNQAACPNQLGTPNVLTTAPVLNIEFGTGKEVKAT
ncbi:hypothetical protein B0H63DRAFT_502271 [Podospora didyma]|uniref:Uncharacterized protein n=1 Tax=Podospora didyma TaxID=330526 RepID=A0AAE0KJ96_9PEZI|nr:hypothetical protein B0H63DRAFT_502271 [Podospora didyma]